MKKLTTFLILAFAVNMMHSQVTVNLAPSQDNSIYSENNNSNGTGNLFSGRTCAGNNRRALIQFDIASNIPAGSTITAVTLTLNVNLDGSAPGNDPYNLHPVTTAWGEGTSFGTGTGGAAVFPDCNWTSATFGVTNWTMPGGDFGPSVATTIIAPSFGNYNWSSAGMVTNVQDWLDNPGNNNGWILIGNETTNCTARKFGSKELGTAPVLSITYTCNTPPTASCQNIVASVNAIGNLTLDASLLNDNSMSSCGGALTFSSSQTTFGCGDVVTMPGDMILTAVFDGNLTGGLPKGIEIFVMKNIPDMSLYGVGSANNGGGSNGQEFTFPAISVNAGTYLYITSDSAGFNNFFGFNAHYVSSAVNINGDDAIELFGNGVVIDVFGDINVDGTGQPWEYMDGFAYRNNGTGPDGTTFTIGNWTMSGINALDPALTNSTAPIPIPVGSYLYTGAIPLTLTVTDGFSNSATCSAAITVIDAAGPDMQCIPPTTFNLDGTGNLTLVDSDIDNGSSDGCSAIMLSLSQYNFSCTDIGVNTVILTGIDANGNSETCSSDITIQMVGGFTITENSVNDVSCNGDNDGAIDVTISGGTSPYIIDWDNDGTGDNDDTEDLSLLSGGVYTLLVTDQSGCTQNYTATINEPAALVLNMIETNVTCQGGNDGELDLIIIGGTSPYDIDWDNDGTGDFDDTEDLSGLSSGNYTVFIVDDNGCTTNGIFTVLDGSSVDVSVNQTGASLTANASGMTYQWLSSSDNCVTYSVLTGETNQSYTATNDGDYAVIVTNGSGCADTSSCLTVFGIGYDEFDKTTITVYPNPTEVGQFTISHLQPNSSIILFDNTGRVVLSFNTTNSAEIIEVNKLNQGIYYLQIIHQNNTELVKVQIVN